MAKIGKKKVMVLIAGGALLAVVIVLLAVFLPLRPRRYGPPPRITVNFPDSGGGAVPFRDALVPAARSDRGFYVYVESLPEEEYVRLLPARLTDPVNGDLWYVVNNSSLSGLAQRGLIEPLPESFINKGGKGIPAPFWTLGALKGKGSYYVPVTWYPWGFYYRKSLFARAGISPPRDWNEFLALCETLKGEGVVPVGMTEQVKWPLLVWFDYLDLRMNGGEKHARWMALDLPFTDPGIVRVAETVVTLRERGIFQTGSGASDWEVLPRDLAEGKTGMVLCGSFIMERIPETLRDDIGWFPFPSMETSAREEIVSGSGFILSARAPNRANALALLEYMTSPDFQSLLTREKTGMLPVLSSEMKQLDREDLEAGYRRASDSRRLFEMSERGMDGRMIIPLKALLVNFLVVDRKNARAILNVLEEERRKILLGGKGDAESGPAR